MCTAFRQGEATSNLLNEIIKQSTNCSENEDLLFNCSYIKANILTHCRSVHKLVDLLFRNLMDYYASREKTDTKLQNSISDLLSISWQQLHTGHWSDVCPEWRSLYALMCLLRTVTLYTNEKKADAIELVRLCDKGLIMGDDVYRIYLHKVVDEIHRGLINIKGIPQVDLDVTEQANRESKKLKQTKLPTSDLRNRIHFSINHQVAVEQETLSLSYFKSKYFQPQIPCLIKGAAKTWEACRKWGDLNYLLEKAAYRVVPVEIGKYYTSEDWSQQLIPFHEYVQQYVIHSSSNGSKIGYLAQHPLFEQINELRKDIQEPTFCMLGDEGEITSVNAWFGPANTISPLHTDPFDNILVQVVGFKYVRIYHPDETPNLYKRTSGLLQANTSEIENLFVLSEQEEERKENMKNYPLLSKAEKYWECILCEGDMLFIPKLYWHYVQSLSTSFSISYWFA